MVSPHFAQTLTSSSAPRAGSGYGMSAIKSLALRRHVAQQLRYLEWGAVQCGEPIAFLHNFSHADGVDRRERSSEIGGEPNTQGCTQVAIDHVKEHALGEAARAFRQLGVKDPILHFSDVRMSRKCWGESGQSRPQPLPVLFGIVEKALAVFPSMPAVLDHQLANET